MKTVFRILPFLPSLLHAAPPTDLGELVVSAMKPAATHAIEPSGAEDFLRFNLAETLTQLPGVSLQRTGARSESMITLRGFDLRQVPLFIDGIPVYIPYDGYVDFGRFTVPGSTEIEVAKGISPVLAGPNTLGGLVNVFTRRPQERLEGDVRAGAFTGEGLEAALRAGGREEKGYWQFDLSWTEQDAFRLSSDFRKVPSEDGGRRENSYREDWRASGRIAWTPAAEDEYAFGFWIQRGEKGNPPYTGSDPALPVRFWQWPQWDKDTFYLLTRTAINPDTTLETKAHYDRFENLLRSFDNAGYNSQNLPRAFNSYYDDRTLGASTMLENRSLANTRIAAALHYKIDRHKEWEPGEPTHIFEDETFSAGIEAEYTLPGGGSITAGISHDWREVNEAVDTNTGAALGGSRNSSWNPQIVYKHVFNDCISGHIGYARKSRFPTIKDRYSYRLGQAIPNPDLDAETAGHFDLGLRGSTSDGRFDWAAGLFLSRIDDAIQRVDRVSFTPEGAALFQLQNVGEAEHKGFEFALDARWTDSIETGLRYAWIDAENRTNPEIKIPGTPENEILLFAKLSLHENLRLIPSFTWTDAREVTSTGKTVGNYARWDIKADISLPHRTTLGLGVTNLLDRNQELDEGFPEPGRSYFVSLRHEF